MQITAIIFLLTVVMVAPAAAHQEAATMLRDAAVSHDLAKIRRQFEKAVEKTDDSVRADR
jgi:hypothetical protein